MFIYLIVNHVTGKYYVGQHKGLDLKRYFQKKFSAARHNHGSSHLFNSMRKHPFPCDWSIHALLSDVQTRSELDQHEKDFISFLKAQDPEYGYNIARGGEGGGSMLGHKHTPETRAKQSASNRGKHRERLMSPENQAVRARAWQQALKEHNGSFHKPETAGKIKEARATQDEQHRLEKFNEYEKEHGAERRARAAATHRGKKHRMSAEGSKAISEAYKRGNRRRWSTHSLVGQVFGRLTVESQAGRSGRGLILWNCLCACGNGTVGRTDLLRNGHKRSCGCLAKETDRRNGSSRFLRQGVS